MTHAGRNFTRHDIELLAPARDTECARAAIDHGADAIYIGAPQFGARKAAANTMEDIEEVVAYAHLFGCRVHVTLNTILYDNEVAAARRMAWQLYEAGVDVLIVQDAALLDTSSMPPIEIHASTQCDNRNASKVLFWQSIGLRQVVLARELSLAEIAEIAKLTTVRLEAFIHGALCVSYSGQCYMSLARGGRSANRGECAQPCRLPYDVLSVDGRTLMRHSFPLSLKDNNQTQNIESLIDAGVSSFKIEGRLKDPGYVANVTLHYRRVIDEILARRNELRRISSGTVTPGFEPQPWKSFNRGFTDYFAHGRQAGIWQPLTPKSLGQPIGKVTKIAKQGAISIRTSEVIANGDGLCFIGHSPEHFCGTKVNTSRPAGAATELNVQNTKGIAVGDDAFRNLDTAFANALAHDKTRRTIDVSIAIAYSGGSFTLTVEDGDGVRTETTIATESQEARSAEATEAQMTRAMTKTGGTAFNVGEVKVSAEAATRFVTASELNAMRRSALEAHAKARTEHFRPADCQREENPAAIWPKQNLTAYANVTNKEAMTFYERHGAKTEEQGYETQQNMAKSARLMTTRHCIMNALGKCIRKHPECAVLTPLTLRDEDGRTYTAKMNCAICQMEIYQS